MAAQEVPAVHTDVITLISQTKTVDEYGDLVTTETSREVFAERRSVGMKEFYQAQAVGLQPEIVFVLSDYLDYQNERYVEYGGRRYNVIRTYSTEQKIEIVCASEVNP